MIIITTLAEYQTKFWVKVCLDLISKGNDVAVLSFDDRSCELLQQAHILNFNIPSLAKETQELNEEEVVKIYSAFKIKNSNFWTIHERLIFEHYCSDKLNQKLAQYILAIDQVIAKDLNSYQNKIVIQELGGFISVLASWFAAKKNSIDTYFLEPSFFKGRLFYLKNKISAPEIDQKEDIKVTQEVKKYIEYVKENKTIVVPEKDRHHYNHVKHKIFNIRNFTRLCEKLFDQFFYKKHQEFGRNLVYAKMHLSMLMNDWLLHRYYTDLSACQDFVYFPFHVPNDVAITLRSPEYWDQLALIDYIARTLPSKYLLVIKEHPAMVGAIDAIRLRKILKRYDNVRLLLPSTNNYDVLNKSSVVLTINSKAGAESILLHKKVLVLGDAFYSDSPFVKKISSFADLKAILNSINEIPPSEEDVMLYFQNVWEHSKRGELYVNEENNIIDVSNLLIKLQNDSR